MITVLVTPDPTVAATSSELIGVFKTVAGTGAGVFATRTVGTAGVAVLEIVVTWGNTGEGGGGGRGRFVAGLGDEITGNAPGAGAGVGENTNDLGRCAPVPVPVPVPVGCSSDRVRSTGCWNAAGALVLDTKDPGDSEKSVRLPVITS